MNNIWFTSDHHFGHKNIIGFCDRPFDSVEEMNEALVTYHNELVKPGDTVYHLGDLAMGDITDSLAWAKKMHGVKYLIPGNHDRMHSLYSEKSTPEYKKKFIQRYHEEAGFTTLFEHTAGREGEMEFNLHLCHLPPSGHPSWETDQRFIDKRPINNQFEPYLHGHTHQKDGGNGWLIHVGVDGRDFRPVNLEQVLEEIASREE